jgi:uncharacterized Zn finger protein
VAATHYLLGDALDGDPFLLFELRGRSKEQVLEDLGKLRSQHARAASPAPASRESTADAEAIPISALTALGFEQSQQDLPSLSFQLNAPAEPGAVLRQLGEPAGWPLQQSPAELLLPIYERAGAHARALATRSENDAVSTTRRRDMTKQRARRKRTEPDA